jgi:hypothetical protein
VKVSHEPKAISDTTRALLPNCRYFKGCSSLHPHCSQTAGGISEYFMSSWVPKRDHSHRRA